VNSNLDDVFYIEKLHSEKTKQLASEISNETARRILKELYRNPTSITDLSTKLDIPVSTVQHHINKLMDLGVIKIAQKRLGKRLKDIKMYVYDKESIVFLSSMEKHEFEHLLRSYVLQRLKKRAPIVVLLLSVIGSILTAYGSWILKEEIEHSIGSFYDIAGGDIVGGAWIPGTTISLFLGVFFILGVVTSFLLFLFIIKVK
jgi:DNA-binding transcriptional ArsR family regulator